MSVVGGLRLQAQTPQPVECRCDFEPPRAGTVTEVAVDNGVQTAFLYLGINPVEQLGNGLFPVTQSAGALQQDITDHAALGGIDKLIEEGDVNLFTAELNRTGFDASDALLFTPTPGIEGCAGRVGVGAMRARVPEPGDPRFFGVSRVQLLAPAASRPAVGIRPSG